MYLLKELSVNFNLAEASKYIPNYSMVMRVFMTKMWMVNFEPDNNMQHFSAISYRSLVEKKEVPQALTISCTIGSLNFTRALCGS